MPSAGCFTEEIKNMKIWFLSHNCMTNVGAPPKPGRRNPRT